MSISTSCARALDACHQHSDALLDSRAVEVADQRQRQHAIQHRNDRQR
jgi:hypothetical protein